MTGGGLVPVTVIGGYLGAGKTTVINRLLTGDHGLRLAVLVNDFGPINLDAELLSAEAGGLVSLENGCVCCSMADALGEGLDRVLELEPGPEAIIIEASGVADPGKIAAYGQGWPGCRLDSVLVAADVETVRARADDPFVGELVTRQLRRADIVLATKLDLVDEPTAAAALAWLGDRSPGPVIAVERGELPAPLLLADRPAMDRPPIGDDDAGEGLDASTLFDAEVLDLPDPVARPRLEAALEAWPEAVVRIKGIVTIDAERPERVLVQRVGQRWSIEPAPGSTLPGSLVVLTLRGSVGAGALLEHLTG